jgi:hypothetical protein
MTNLSIKVMSPCDEFLAERYRISTNGRRPLKGLSASWIISPLKSSHWRLFEEKNSLDSRLREGAEPICEGKARENGPTLSKI